MTPLTWFLSSSYRFFHRAATLPAVRAAIRRVYPFVSTFSLISLISSPPNEAISATFTRLGLSIEDGLTTVDTAPAVRPATRNKKISVFTDGKNGQRVDSDANHHASLYVGRKCEMTLFDPNDLPSTLLEGIKPLVDRQQVKSSFEYEADLLIYEGCWRQAQTQDFRSYLDAPQDAKPLSKIMAKRRAMAVLFDLFGDPPREWKDEAGTDLSTYRNVARFLFHLHQTRPRLVDRELPGDMQC